MQRNTAGLGTCDLHVQHKNQSLLSWVTVSSLLEMACGFTEPSPLCCALAGPCRIDPRTRSERPGSFRRSPQSWESLVGGRAGGWGRQVWALRFDVIQTFRWDCSSQCHIHPKLHPLSACSERKAPTPTELWPVPLRRCHDVTKGS